MSVVTTLLLARCRVRSVCSDRQPVIIFPPLALSKLGLRIQLHRRSSLSKDKKMSSSRKVLSVKFGRSRLSRPRRDAQYASATLVTEPRRANVAKRLMFSEDWGSRGSFDCNDFCQKLKPGWHSCHLHVFRFSTSL